MRAFLKKRKLLCVLDKNGSPIAMRKVFFSAEEFRTRDVIMTKSSKEQRERYMTAIKPILNIVQNSINRGMHDLPFQRS